MKTRKNMGVNPLLECIFLRGEVEKMNATLCINLFIP